MLGLWRARLGSEAVHILDATGARGILTDADINGLPVQAMSDILRLRLLHAHGGVWFDPTVYPSPWFPTWFRDMRRETEFFAPARPHPTRPISNWFLASAAGCPLLGKWRDLLETYWSRPRHYATRTPQSEAAKRWMERSERDPLWSVDPNGGAREPFIQYYAAHHLFAHLIETDAEAAGIWNSAPPLYAPALHLVQQCRAETEDAEFLRHAPHLLASAPMQKLNWRLDWPDAFLDDMLI